MDILQNRENLLRIAVSFINDNFKFHAGMQNLFLIKSDINDHPRNPLFYGISRFTDVYKL